MPQFRPETARGRVFVALRQLVHRRENGAAGRRWGRRGGSESHGVRVTIQLVLDLPNLFLQVGN